MPSDKGVIRVSFGTGGDAREKGKNSEVYNPAFSYYEYRQQRFHDKEELFL